MTYRDNEIKFTFLNRVSLWSEGEKESYGYFKLKDFKISKGQDPKNKITLGNYPISKNGVIKFEIGRHNSQEVAQKWNDEIEQITNATTMNEIHEANFVLKGDLVLNVTGGIFGPEHCVCTIPDIVLTQYGSGNLINLNNYWQFGSQKVKINVLNRVVVETDVEGDTIDVVVEKEREKNYGFLLNFFQRELDDYTSAYFIRAESKNGVRNIIKDGVSICLEGEFGKLRYKALKAEYGEPLKRGIWDCIRIGLDREKKILDVGRIFRISILNKAKKGKQSLSIDTLHIVHQLYKAADGKPEYIEEGIEYKDYPETRYEAIKDERDFADLPSVFYIRNNDITEESSYEIAIENWAYRDVVYEMEEEIVSQNYKINRYFTDDSIDLKFSRQIGFKYENIVTKQNSDGFIRLMYSGLPFHEKMTEFRKLNYSQIYKPYLEYIFEKKFGIDELDMLGKMDEGKSITINEQCAVEKPKGVKDIIYIAKYKVKKIKAIVACGDVAVNISGIYDVEYLGCKQDKYW